ncbi:MAG: hypothetical protein ACLTID_10860 [Barnesiella sp.]
MKKQIIIALAVLGFFPFFTEAQILNHNFEKINIYYENFSIMEICDVPCENFENRHRSIVQHNDLTDSLAIIKWIGILNRLNKADTENKYFDRILDTRGKLFLYSCKDTIQICLDYRYTDINNERFDTSSELRLELEKMFHKPKPKKQKENNRK